MHSSLIGTESKPLQFSNLWKRKVEIFVIFSAIKLRQSCCLLKDLCVSAPLNPSLVLVMLLMLRYITKKS